MSLAALVPGRRPHMRQSVNSAYCDALDSCSSSLAVVVVVVCRLRLTASAPAAHRDRSARHAPTAHAPTTRTHNTHPPHSPPPASKCAAHRPHSPSLHLISPAHPRSDTFTSSSSMAPGMRIHSRTSAAWLHVEGEVESADWPNTRGSGTVRHVSPGLAPRSSPPRLLAAHFASHLACCGVCCGVLSTQTLLPTLAWHNVGMPARRLMASLTQQPRRR